MQQQQRGDVEGIFIDADLIAQECFDCEGVQQESVRHAGLPEECLEPM